MSDGVRMAFAPNVNAGRAAATSVDGSARENLSVKVALDLRVPGALVPLLAGVAEVASVQHHVQVTAPYRRLACVACGQVRAECCIPCALRIERFEALAGIDDIGPHDVVIFILGRDDAALLTCTEKAHVR